MPRNGRPLVAEHDGPTPVPRIGDSKSRRGINDRHPKNIGATILDGVAYRLHICCCRSNRQFWRPCALTNTLQKNVITKVAAAAMPTGPLRALAARMARGTALICPSGGLLTGVSSLISDFPKNISVPICPKSDLQLSHPTPLQASAGRIALRERLAACKTTALLADGEVVWS
jgi:hypothetical protein